MSCWDNLLSIADTLVPLPGPEGLRMRFRPIPAGEFVMGSRGYSEREEPPHRVVIPHDFYLGKYVVTQREWRALVEALRPEGLELSPSRFKGDCHPVERVSWDEVTAWCAAWSEWLATAGHGKEIGIATVRLPAEAEWEYACRAGSDTDYWNGDGEAALREVGWFAGNAGGTTHDVTEEVVQGFPERHPAGLVGMHGNVLEYCADAFDERAYRQRLDGWQAGAPWDPSSDKSARYRSRVFRGGSCIQPSRRCRSAYRNWHDVRLVNLGFRVCLVRGLAAGKQAVGGGAAAAPPWEGARLPALPPAAEPRTAATIRPKPGKPRARPEPGKKPRGT
ncbi:MAG: formylglycine-generating enzyme family protein [Planctomycetia bacterium]|nr:formylglycine-generating enzyme family protein [Planctomycetia bacterium]